MIRVGSYSTPILANANDREGSLIQIKQINLHIQVGVNSWMKSKYLLIGGYLGFLRIALHITNQHLVLLYICLGQLFCEDEASYVEQFAKISNKHRNKRNVICCPQCVHCALKMNSP